MTQHNEKSQLSELAGEYVLGTLNDDERRDFERALADDLRLQAEVSAWEQRLCPMLETAEPVTPPEKVWKAVEQRIEGPVPQPRPGLWGSLGFWRNLGMVTAGLLVVVSLTLFQLPQDGGMDRVMVVNNDRAGAGWIVSTGGQEGMLQVKAVAPTPMPQGKYCLLWMETPDGRMLPVGILPHEGSQSMAIPAVLGDNSRFKVTIEQDSGAPLTAPRGNVVFEGSLVTVY